MNQKLVVMLARQKLPRGKVACLAGPYPKLIYALSTAKKIRLSDFQSRILQTVRHPQGSDFTNSVQVGVHPGQRDYDQSFIPTTESREIGFYFVTMDTTLLYIM